MSTLAPHAGSDHDAQKTEVRAAALLGVLGVDAVEIHWRQGFGDDVADLGVGIALLGVGEADLGLVILDQFHDMQVARDMGLAGLGIDIHLDVILGAVMGLGGALHRLLHGGQHDLLVDGLVARHGIGDLQQFKAVGGNCAGHDLFLLRVRRLARLEIFVDELVGENVFRVDDAAKRKTDIGAADAGIADHDIAAVHAQKDGAEALALAGRGGNHGAEFDLGLVPGPACEILGPG